MRWTDSGTIDAVDVLNEMLESAYVGAFDRPAFGEAAPRDAAAQTIWYDKIAIAIARGYMHDQSDFETADAAINELWSAMIDDSTSGTGGLDVLPGFANEIYDAFDAGEDAHGGPARHTRPALEKILAAPETLRAFAWPDEGGRAG